ncbi:MAG: DUF58 domain-containing protein [Deferrisomatales bacterium]
MLSPEWIRKIRQVHIRTGHLVNTVMAGDYRSAFRGVGMEFEEVREYVPGDDVKSIDWNITARTGRPHVKRYREERELVIWLLVDMSASGTFGTAESAKRDVMAETAAILAFNAIRNNDKVGAILFSDRVEGYIPPKKGASHVWRVIKEVLTHEPRGRGTDLAEALRFFGGVARKRSVAFLVSDFLAEGYEGPLRIAARRHELIGVLVRDPGDGRLPPAGLVEVEDLETGATAVLDASDPRARAAYERLAGERRRRALEVLRRADVDPIEIATDGSLVDPLLRYFRQRERRRWR